MPSRPSNGHVHPEYWLKTDHDRYEDRVTAELRGLRDDVSHLSNRLALMVGGIAVLVFGVNILAPIFQNLLNVPVAK